VFILRAESTAQVPSIKPAQEHKYNTKALQKHKNRTLKKQKNRKCSNFKKTAIQMKKWNKTPKFGIA
jgi:hypothetical protein